MDTCILSVDIGGCHLSWGGDHIGILLGGRESILRIVVTQLLDVASGLRSALLLLLRGGTPRTLILNLGRLSNWNCTPTRRLGLRKLCICNGGCTPCRCLSCLRTLRSLSCWLSPTATGLGRRRLDRSSWNIPATGSSSTMLLLMRDLVSLM